MITAPKRMKLSHEQVLCKGPSCADYTLGLLMGCNTGVSGVMQSEHSILCAEFWSQSPQRMKMVAQYCATQMLTGREVLTRGYKRSALTLLGMSDMISDDDFEVQWVAFTIIQRARANELPDLVAKPQEE